MEFQSINLEVEGEERLHMLQTPLRIEIQKKPQLTALDVKNLHPELIQNVSC